MSIRNEFDKKIEVSTQSQMMVQAIEHTNKNGGVIENLIHDLVMQWLGPYEDAALARNWSERNAIYTRNAHRKTTRLAMEEYLMREGTVSGGGREDNSPADQNNQSGTGG